MTPTLLDANVLLDVATDDRTWGDWSAQQLAKAADTGPLIINAIVYAEVSTSFPKIEDLDDALPPDEYRREPLPFEAGFLAGKAFLAYQRRGGAGTSPLPDFFIGAHAAIAGYRLLTRDANRYARYFPSVPLIAPGENDA